MLERVAACLAEFEETTTNRLRSCAEGATVVSKAAANALPLPGGTVLTHPDAAEKVRERVPRHVDVVGVEQPELARADGALTCGVVVLDPFFSWRTFS